MPDPAEQLQRIYLAGFELQTFDRFPKCVGVVRDNCVALLVPSIDGLQMLGTPGWRMGEAIGVLVEAGGRQIFQAKQETLEATPEKLEILSRFRAAASMFCFQPDMFPMNGYDMPRIQRVLLENFLFGVVTLKGYKQIEKYKSKEYPK